MNLSHLLRGFMGQVGIYEEKRLSCSGDGVENASWALFAVVLVGVAGEAVADDDFASSSTSSLSP